MKTLFWQITRCELLFVRKLKIVFRCNNMEKGVFLWEIRRKSQVKNRRNEKHFVILYKEVLSYCTKTFCHIVQRHFVRLYKDILSDCTKTFCHTVQRHFVRLYKDILSFCTKTFCYTVQSVLGPCAPVLTRQHWPLTCCKLKWFVKKMPVVRWQRCDAWCNGLQVCFPSLPPMLLRRFESRLGLES